MLTRCPACATTFRVTPEQLKIRLGRVRCGACNTVFNALDALVEEVVVPLPEQSEAATPGNVYADGELAAPLPAQVPEAQIAPVPEPVMDDRHPTLITADEVALALPDPPATEQAESSETDPPPAAVTEPESATEPETLADAEDTVAPPAFEPTLHEPRSPRRWPWLVGSLFALLALTAQALMHFRSEISVLQPDLKPLLQAACAAVGCQVPLPQKIDQLGIETSDLQPTDGQKGRLQLTATLHNRAPFAQEYPLLELTLTDVADKPLIVKSLQPAEYLPTPLNATAGFAAGGTLPISLLLDAGDTPAAGYRLYLYYP
ncbi:MAG: zinc-ribbon domain-containing protein [Rhodocyclaceae bacterium]|nr:zinc-ribbon domain-containing protein [Rhodocyclaceae bacterium]